MADASITRGTTPVITLTVEGMDLTDYSCYLSVGAKAGKAWFTADNEQMVFGYDGTDSTLTYTLTQAQTLACKAGAAYIQLRCVKDDYAAASGWASVEILPIILDGEVADEYDTD